VPLSSSVPHSRSRTCRTCFLTETTTLTSHRKHSLEFLRETERIIALENPSCVIVSGDVSNGGDLGSLNLARDWLLNKVSVGYGEELGLRLSEKRIPLLVIPGNHDAWNSGASGKYQIRFQTALDNFRIAFPTMVIAVGPVATSKPSHEQATGEPAPEFDWHEIDGHGVFVAAFSSCYCDGVPSPDRIAVGKVTIQQTTILLDIFDRGMQGQLLDPRSGKTISADAFARSLKIGIMHHYLFEPPDAKAEPLLRLKERRRVVRNLLYAHFDILLCGHKHFIDTRPEYYGSQFDSRSRARYLVNCYRRALGIDTLPVQYYDKDGKPISKWFSLLVNVVAKTTPASDIEHLLEALQRVSTDPARARSALAALAFTADDATHVREVSVAEALRIGVRLANCFKREQREALAEYVKTELRRVLGGLVTRPFVQIMSGSTTKQGSTSKSVRGLNIYSIQRGMNAYVVRVTPYWSRPNPPDEREAPDGAVKFTPIAPVDIEFTDARHPRLFSSSSRGAD